MKWIIILLFAFEQNGFIVIEELGRYDTYFECRQDQELAQKVVRNNEVLLTCALRKQQK